MLPLSDVYIPDTDVGESQQDKIRSDADNRYQEELKGNIRDYPFDLVEPKVSKYLKINSALLSNDDDFPTTPDAELALRAKVPIRFAKECARNNFLKQPSLNNEISPLN
ncbi:hypothetical protein [Bathymodiolus platifrons methanotrophic gill symbiont]|uniref:hypothetical protein n=1 Tax=Bathymodiolus platifrons methanotrophic gill symbiont TaxID=113268 RepID=UPI001C8E2A6B|nr:hypothetical protein [Bathymodiolus platifrons methanotrophic gill symbiont]